MNITAKILMLVAAIVAAVLAVLYYARTITEPPLQTKFPNAHLASLRTDMERLEKHPSMEVADSVFNVTLHAARYFNREGLISMKESDDVIAKLTKLYAPFFITAAKVHFNNSTWSTDKNKELRRRAKLLNGLRTQEDHKPILDVNENIRKDVDSVAIVIDAYDKAVQLCKDSSFYSLKSAKERVSNARSYANMHRLKKCTSLLNQLFELPKRIEKSHYKHVVSKVEAMKDYRKYEEYYYRNNIAVEASNAIEEYENNANKIYGTQTSLEYLKKIYDDYWKEAMSKYHPKKDNDRSNTEW